MTTIFSGSYEMDSKNIEGKEVIAGKSARLIGKVEGIEVDTASWKVTSIRLDVDKNVIEDLGLKKPRIGGIKVVFPVEIIDGISDKIILTESLDQLKNIVKKI
jgi:sporulation protein YlmC with PRC-barrel domain